MPASTPAPIKFGAICWNQYTDWQGLPQHRGPDGRGQHVSCDEESMTRLIREVKPMLEKAT